MDFYSPRSSHAGRFFTPPVPRKRAEGRSHPLKQTAQKQLQVIGKMEQEIGQKDFQIAELKVEIQRLQRQPPALPQDPALPHHELGPKMIAMCVNLGARVGLRASKMPPPGVALTHQDVRLLNLEPGLSWKREDMARAYDQLARRIGAPLALIVDGAVELREGADVLEKYGKNVVTLGDFKHFAANVLKKSVGQNERFVQFMSQVRSTRSISRACFEAQRLGWRQTSNLFEPVMRADP